MKRIRYAIFISGTGSNLGAALEMRDHVDVALVVSSKKSALGLLKAKRAGVPTMILSNPVDWNHLHEELLRTKIDRIFLLGFMKLLPGDFVEKWAGKILNIHPSLLPKYPGLESIRRAYEDRSELGVTIHEVTADMDAGPIVLQRKLFKNADDTFESLEFKVHQLEHLMVREVMGKWNRVTT